MSLQHFLREEWPPEEEAHGREIAMRNQPSFIHLPPPFRTFRKKIQKERKKERKEKGRNSQERRSPNSPRLIGPVRLRHGLRGRVALEWVRLGGAGGGAGGGADACDGGERARCCAGSDLYGAEGRHFYIFIYIYIYLFISLSPFLDF
jgi:hypothetical protein